ncbi:MAG: PfkB family carbohydrate kinase, partial [Pseudothermotoga sp.]
VALAEGKSLEQAVRFANAAAALSVTKLGAQPSVPSRTEIESILNRSYLLSSNAQSKLNSTILTHTEKRVLQLVAEEKTNEEISGQLSISRRTVEYHISSIFRKLDVDTRVGAVMEGIKNGIVKLYE